jgi:hypothetical protein
MIELIARVFRSPHLFVYLILFLYACSSVRYLYAGKYGNAMYWVCAIGITIAATFLMDHGGAK